ncbi:hypothetical protein M2318_004667 [Metapseudomonas resinovorans]
MLSLELLLEHQTLSFAVAMAMSGLAWLAYGHA